jgi:NAD(P)-dependent dehydrogenase (short-subunit alcohol dehydrogenase family)
MQLHTEDGHLAQQIILITGAAQGIGASVAKACAKAGATVILLDKQVPKLEGVYDEIVEQSGNTPAIYPLDLKGATVDDYRQLAITISENFGRLDALVHCAATLGQLAPVINQDAKTWAETLHINLTAAYLLTQACLPLLKQQSSQLIFTTDTHTHTAYWGAYGISKAAIEAFAGQLHDELETEGKVSVTTIDPGEVRTSLFARAYPAKSPEGLKTPDDVVDLYLSKLKKN